MRSSMKDMQAKMELSCTILQRLTKPLQSLTYMSEGHLAHMVSGDARQKASAVSYG